MGGTHPTGMGGTHPTGMLSCVSNIFAKQNTCNLDKNVVKNY